MEFLYYFDDVFTLWAFGMLLLGTVFGLILGATPGLSPTMAVALAIPFTFKMEPAHGLILLGALYTSTVAGGAVSAILLKIPGAPANIATTLDGFIARPDHAIDWLEDATSAATEDYGYEEFVKSVSSVVMGRKTFQKIMAFPEWCQRWGSCWPKCIEIFVS